MDRYHAAADSILAHRFCKHARYCEKDIAEFAQALREAAVAARAEAFFEVAKNLGCECSSAAPVECAMCGARQQLEAKARAAQPDARME